MSIPPNSDFSHSEPEPDSDGRSDIPAEETSPAAPGPDAPEGDRGGETAGAATVGQGEESEDQPVADQSDQSGECGEDREGEWREVFRETLQEELGAATAENRRTARRQMEVLKGLGEAVNAIGRMVGAVHATTREAVAASARESARPQDSDALLLPLIELADRIDRAVDSGSRPPDPVRTWLPGAKAAAAPWKIAWDRQRDAFRILQTHMAALLQRAGLEPISADGRPFDPAVMTAVEVVTDAERPDHSIDAVVLAGWRLAGGGRVIRPAQVRVSRKP